jgi:membrane-bound lytic murein transglycosylase D
MKRNSNFFFIGLVSLAFYMPVYSNPSDTTSMFLNDTLDIDLVLNDSIESNFDANLDSMLDLYYIENSEHAAELNKISEITDIVPDFSDSVYIERLASIPTVVNLSYNKIVKNYIDLYTKKKRESVQVMLGLSQYYFPIFDDIFDYYNVPNELKYMSIIESALNPRASSRTRAVGLWQFMYGTGRVYGLEINSLVDERCDPIKATYAAASYVKDLYEIYHDWILVIAAYNCGPGNVNRAIRRAGGKTNYWDIYYYLPRETRGHIPAFIAATYVMNYYKEHNLAPALVEMPLEFDTVQVNQQLDLRQVSEVLALPIKQLRDLNPQYRYDIIPAGKKSYPLFLPKDYTMSFIDFEDSIYTYKDSLYFNPNRLTVTPNSRSNDGFIPEAPGDDYIKLVYVVKSGDNLGFISEWYDVRLRDIQYWNNIRRNSIRAGQKLAIYKPKNKAEKYRKIDKMTFAQKQESDGITPIMAQAPVESAANYKGDYVFYTVRSGDTIWEIAQKFPGVSDNDIMRLNNINDVSKIKPGMQLKIKPKN